ncbi:NAD(P)-binding protein-23 [Lipomyces kononenkoae]
MVGSKDLQPSTKSFGRIFFSNQFRAKPQWPAPNTNLSGKTAIITGSNTGLGYEAARQLLDLKLSHLILAVRSPEKGEAAAAQLRLPHPNAYIEVWQLDMCSYDSVQAFARRAESQLSRIDFVLLNAGMIGLNYTTVKSTGHVECIQVNYISTMLLAVLFLPILKVKGPPDGQPARLTIVGAAVTLAAEFPNRTANPLLPSFDDPKTYNPRDHYDSSKLLAEMFLWNLVDYVSANDVIINLADPAWCKDTELARDVTGAMKVALKLFSLTGRTREVGASCFVDALVNKGKESHGCFLMSWNIHPFPAFLYTPEGKVVMQRLWDETLAELDFAGVRTILNSMKAKVAN